ncbi:T9SS type A sorting domain-containing protein [bacterium BMS3Abin03]|nr:T9SS type A sorting domain-containing protein [bacterium BMS3Abin03]
MKSFTILLFVLSIQIYSQNYLNIHFTDDSYKYSSLSSLQKITFNAENQMIVLLSDETTFTTDLSLVGGMTYDSDAQGDPLPVELVSFTGELNGNSVTLFWTTETEVANYGFDVERKIEDQSGKEDSWTKIGFVQGQGNSNSPKEYSFIDDDSPQGMIQYRLKQIDIDGHYQYSEIVNINNGEIKDYELLQNFPNPFNPTTRIVYRIPEDSFVSLKVFNVLGKEVNALVNENIKAGTHSILFNGNSVEGGLSSGVYFIRFSSGNYTRTLKMIFVK